MTTASSLPPRETRNKRPRLKVRTQVQDILNYPTETVSIDYYGFAHDNKDGTEMTIPPHTILLFVPGNPGCIQWYIQLLYGLVSSLGIGFAARGVSYAGHGVSDAIANVQQYDTDESNNTSKRDTRIPWTVDGQMDHKMEWIDMIIHELKNEFPRQEPPRFIFLTHSIGAHLVQRLLVIRSDVLIRSILILHLMSFMRMDAPKPQQTILSAISRHPHQVIFIAQLLSQACKRLPNSYLNSWMKRSIQDMNAREFAVSLLQQPHMARNFFTLGCQEIRDLPQQPDVSLLLYALDMYYVAHACQCDCR